MKRVLLQVVLLMIAICGAPQLAHAYSCTISGVYKVEPMDQFYCDTTVLGSTKCQSYFEKDLDTKTGANAAPLQYLHLEFWLGSTTYLGRTITDSSGAYSITLQRPTPCNDTNVHVRTYWARVGELVSPSDPYWTYRFRFVDVDDWTDQLYTFSIINSLAGSTTTHNITFAKTSNPSLSTRLANVYYTMNSAISEVKNWSTNLSSQFSSVPGSLGSSGAMRIAFGSSWPTGGGFASDPDWLIQLAYDVHPFGLIARHELGHLVQNALHYRDQAMAYSPCFSYNFNFTANEQVVYGCEYGHAATGEGFATFLGIRSLTGNDTNVWECKCATYSTPDICSQAAAAMSTGAGDKIASCAGGTGTFIAMGDDWVTSTSQCVSLSGGSQACNCGSSPCPTLWSQANGWRNAVQIVRFLWDMVDTSTDSGSDDTDLSIYDVVDVMEGMPCGTSGYGQDGNCNEFNRAPGGTCSPATDGATSPTGTGTRDAYNMWDFAELIPGNQVDERALDCMGTPPD